MRGECPNPKPDCKYADKGGCFSDVHHQYYPRRAYVRSEEKEFRELPDHKEVLCRAEHDELHATEFPPPKPSREVMLGAISTYWANNRRVS